jgi:hypothetical protein
LDLGDIESLVVFEVSPELGFNGGVEVVRGDGFEGAFVSLEVEVEDFEEIEEKLVLQELLLD